MLSIGQLIKDLEIEKGSNPIPRSAQNRGEACNNILTDNVEIKHIENIWCISRRKAARGPITVNPYRYPHFQKGEISRLIAQMLDEGVICLSWSTFSPPVLLLKKRDGT